MSEKSSIKDAFSPVLGNQRGLSDDAASERVRTDNIKEEDLLKLEKRVLHLDVAPYFPPNREQRKRYQPTRNGQKITVLLMRQGDKDYEGRVWGASPVLAFSSTTSYVPGKPFRYIGTNTFAGPSGLQDDGLCRLSGEEPTRHYLDREAWNEVCEWLKKMEDGSTLTAYTYYDT
jgi:hypothetical protein